MAYSGARRLGVRRKDHKRGRCAMRALIVYGTRGGGTAGLAHMLATAFEREGWRADVRDAADAPGIGDVDVVVVGGGLCTPVAGWRPCGIGRRGTRPRSRSSRCGSSAAAHSTTPPVPVTLPRRRALP